MFEFNQFYPESGNCQTIHINSLFYLDEYRKFIDLTLDENLPVAGWGLRDFHIHPAPLESKTEWLSDIAKQSREYYVYLLTKGMPPCFENRLRAEIRRNAPFILIQ